MLITLLTSIHVLVAIGIIGLVLLQRGKGAEAGAGFGSGASGTVFGARGSSTFFSKSTAVLVSVFFVTSLSLAYLASHRAAAPKSILDQVPASRPALPVGPAPVPSAPSAVVPAAPSTTVLPASPSTTVLPPAPAPAGNKAP